MIDLHLHLDGSLSADNILQLSAKCGVDLPTRDKTQLAKMLACPIECASLNDYLKCFEIPLLVLQNKECLRLALRMLHQSLSIKNMLYAEVRFAPVLHTRQGLSQSEAVEAICAELAELSSNKPKLNIILCCMRGASALENKQTVKVAAKWLGKGVVAVDLAGAEAVYSTQDYAEVFALARELKVPFTVHCGEAAGIESVIAAVDFGAVRLGHAVALIDSADCVEKVRKRHIGIEMCPTSNLETGAVKSLKDYPLRKYLDEGLQVTVNTDNMTVSATDIYREFELLKTELKLTDAEVRKLLYNAVEIAFLSSKDKAILLEELGRLI